MATFLEMLQQPECKSVSWRVIIKNKKVYMWNNIEWHSLSWMYKLQIEWFIISFILMQN